MSATRTLNTSKVYGGGRAQIPKEVRNILDVKDGDRIEWVLSLQGGTIYIRKAK